MEDNEITEKITGSAIKAHKAVGTGLLASAYQACLYYELVKTGLSVEKEKPLPLVYEEVKLDCGFRMDLVAERRIIVEVKCVDALSDIHLAQVLTCLKLNNNRFGLLINFNVLKLKEGIKRIAKRELIPCSL